MMERPFVRMWRNSLRPIRKFVPLIKRVLYDSACDRGKIKKKFENNLGLELRVSFNPRRKQEISVNLPRCIEKNYAGMMFLYVKQDTGRISLYTPLAGDLPLISIFFQPIHPCLQLPYLLLQWCTQFIRLFDKLRTCFLASCTFFIENILGISSITCFFHGTICVEYTPYWPLSRSPSSPPLLSLSP